MNKRVFIMMLILVITFLCGLYIFKIFFPQEFVLSVENEQIVKIGKYIEEHAWANYSVGFVLSFIAYWLYLCAVCQKYYLTIKDCILVIITIAFSIIVNKLNMQLTPTYGYLAFLILPVLIGNAKLKTVAIVCSTHTIAQCLSVSIRNLPAYMQNVNMLSIALMGIDCYLWLILFYIIYNYKHKEVNNELGNSADL